MNEKNPDINEIKSEIGKNMRNQHGIPNPDEIKKILDVITDKVPELLKELSDILYGEQSSEKYATSAASFYKKLKEAGMSDEQAFDLTKQYMSTLSIGQMMNTMGSTHHHH